MEMLDDIVTEFLVESYENLDRLDQDLLALEEVPDDRNRLSSVFRAIHTIKGTSGFLAFNKLEHVTHVGESLLVQLRDGKMRLNSVIANGLLALVDAVRQIMASIESGQGEGDTDYSALVATLERLQVTGGVETSERVLEEREAAAPLKFSKRLPSKSQPPLKSMHGTRTPMPRTRSIRTSQRVSSRLPTRPTWLRRHSPSRSEKTAPVTLRPTSVWTKVCRAKRRRRARS